MKYIVLLGRILYSLILIKTSFAHFTQKTIGEAANAGIPIPEILVPLSGIIIFLGGASILFGYKARLGAVLLILFLVPATVMVHNFWHITNPLSIWGFGDPTLENKEEVMFLKNLSMLGAALLIGYFGSGPLSIDQE
jgi:putative oxidoreductase